MHIPNRAIIVALLFTGFANPIWAGNKEKPVPAPPGTGAFTIQLVVPGKERVTVKLDLPSIYTDGTPIPKGTGLTFKFYRSPDGLQPYKASGVRIVDNSTATIGQPFGAIPLDVPVGNEPPYMVFLGASVIVNGVESALTTSNLTFQYKAGGGLTRFATAAAALKAIGKLPEDKEPKIVDGTVPSPPGTGKFTIQSFTRGTQRVAVNLEMPTTFEGGKEIPKGTSVTFKLYRSTDGVAPYKADGVRIVAGSTGTIGEPFGAIALDVPVDDKAPYLVFLGATATVKGKESAMTTNNLTFRYAPAFTRFATPQDVLAKGDAAASLEGDWGVIAADDETATLTIKIKGDTFTGFSKNNKGDTLTMKGTVMNRVYEFSFTTVDKAGKSFSHTGRFTLSADGKRLTFEVTSFKGAPPAEYMIEGRTITRVPPKKK